jgi:hypothetical protein
VNRDQHAGAHEKRSEQRQRERRDREQQGPALEEAALLRDGERMDQRRTRKPGHEGRVLHRIPEPPPAPAELVVGPPAAERDADREEQPGRERPGPRPPRPGGIEPPFEQRRAGEGEGNCEADVAGVEDGWMHGQGEILQERIEIAPFGSGRNQASEGIRGRQHEELEAEADHAEEADDAAAKRRIEGAAACRDRQRPAGQAERPQEQRALVRAPDGGDPIEKRQLRMRIRSDVQHGKITLDERPGERAEGQRDEHELADDRGPGCGHP